MRRARICVLTAALAAAPLAARACPFCSAESSTLTEELAACDTAVIARLVEKGAAPPAEPQEGLPYGRVDPETGAATFVVDDVLRGPALVEQGQRIEALYFGSAAEDSRYLIRGVGDPPDWAIPLPLSPTAVAYVKKLDTLPESGADRVAFFQDYLQHEDPLLAQDAYDEFARAPYDDVKDLKDRMDREQLLAWIEDPEVSPSRRRLFFTMLGVCGTEEDVPRLEAMLLADSRLTTRTAEAMSAAAIAAGGPLAATLTIEAVTLNERRKKLGLDALVACYLTLRGGDGLDLIDQRFLSGERVAGKPADYSHIYSTLMAIRFLAEETSVVPMDRILQSARLLLDNPDFADQVIPDLARWEDWTVLERLADMYERAGSENVKKYVREPIITYLDVAAEQGGDVAERAKRALARIEGVDPEAVRRARSLRAFGFLAQARDTPAAASDEPEPNADAADPATEGGDSEMPDPSAFSADQPDQPAPAEKPGAQTASVDQTPTADAPAEAATDAGQERVADATPTAAIETPESLPDEGPTTAGQADPSSAGVAQAGAAPSRWLLVGAPLLVGVVCYGLFWLILRSGSA